MPDGQDDGPSHKEMVHELVERNSSHLSEIRDKFNHWEEDRDGAIDKVEFRKAMKKLHLPGYDDDEKYDKVCDAVFAMIDVDHGGAINYVHL